MAGEEYVYKILLLGDSSVGKTCFLLRYTDKTFKSHKITIGLDYSLKSMRLKSGRNIKLQIWDTAGQDRFRAITKNYFKGSQGIILIYDVTNRQTFENLKNWISQIREEATQNEIIYIVANKIDMEDGRIINKEEGEKFAEELGVPYIETSAKIGINVDKTFEDLAERIDKVFGLKPRMVKKNLLYEKKNKKCC